MNARALFKEHKFRRALRSREEREFRAAVEDRVRTEVAGVRRMESREALRARHLAAPSSVLAWFTVPEAALIAGISEERMRGALARHAARGMIAMGGGLLRTAENGDLSTHINARELSRLMGAQASYMEVR